MYPDDDITGAEVSKSTSKGYITKRRRILRKGIEEEMGREWNEVEESLEKRLQKVTERRHGLIRSSPQMIAVAEMILSHRKPMEIVKFLRKHDSMRFGEQITDAALLGQVLRFKEEVISALESEDGEDVSTSILDFYARLSGKQHVDIHAMMVKLVLFQETRLCAAYEREQERTHAWMRDKSDKKAERKMYKAWKEGSKELDQYWKFLMSLATYELMGQRDSAERREHMHEVMKFSRGYLPR
jgi:hypothetical protein